MRILVSADPKMQSCASGHTAALAVSTNLCRVEKDILCVGLEIHMVWKLIGDSVDDDGVIMEWTLRVVQLEGCRS